MREKLSPKLRSLVQLENITDRALLAFIATSLKTFSRLLETDLSIWSTFRREKINACPFITKYLECPDICVKIIPSLDHATCPWGGLWDSKETMLKDIVVISDMCFKKADKLYKYAFRNDRMAMAKNHGYNSICECTMELYKAYRSTNMVAERLKLSSGGVQVELKSFGVEMLPKGGARLPWKHKQKG
jgi:hypothetical protein